VYHTSNPVPVRRPASLDWASSRPRLTTTPLPFSYPSALRTPGVRTSTSLATCHAWHTREADLPVLFPVKSRDWLGFTAHPSALVAFASRKVAVSGERRQRSEFDLDKQRRSYCRGTATKASSVLSFRFAGKPRGSSKSGRVLVPPLRANPNQGQAYALRSTAPLQ